ncbi:MAG: hypothetical protein LBS69_09670 [Prevotellaceae bacterium]|jgi:hypothetical protein|nr:hypothetical protein [Prevotellaceae bacterium]
MKKILNTLKFAAILLILAGIIVACGKDENNMNTIGVKGIIDGYHKCNDFENGVNGVLVFGIYIVMDKKDTLLSYNIPHEILCSLLEVTSLENFEQGGLYFNRDISPIIFDYREAEKHEIVTIACPQLALWLAYPGQYAKQIIITKINGETIK